MICPWCGETDAEVKGNAFANADIYDKRNLVVTECCDKPVTITPVRKYRIEKYTGDATEDDWGNTIKREIDFRALKRGDLFMSTKKKIVHVDVTQAGGAGMGEYPESRRFVLTDGSVWEWIDPGWLKKGTTNPKRIQGGLK